MSRSVTAADTLIIQDDGNVVLYGSGRAWWASRGGLIATFRYIHVKDL